MLYKSYLSLIRAWITVRYSNFVFFLLVSILIVFLNKLFHCFIEYVEGCGASGFKKKKF